MLKTMELRIGNWVYVRDKVAKQVSSLSSAPRSAVICTVLDSCTWAEAHFSESAVEPIPLTEEWLFKLGFKKTEKNKNWFSIWWDKDAFMVYLNPSDIVGIVGHTRRHQNIKWVHTLQNAFNALTGEELEVKL